MRRNLIRVLRKGRSRRRAQRSRRARPTRRVATPTAWRRRGRATRRPLSRRSALPRRRKTRPPRTAQHVLSRPPAMRRWRSRPPPPEGGRRDSTHLIAPGRGANRLNLGRQARSPRSTDPRRDRAFQRARTVFDGLSLSAGVLAVLGTAIGYSILTGVPTRTRR